MIRLLLRANRKLMGLIASDPTLAAAAAAADSQFQGGGGSSGSSNSSIGVRQDVRRLADSYGKTAGRLAWDMQRCVWDCVGWVGWMMSGLLGGCCQCQWHKTKARRL